MTLEAPPPGPAVLGPIVRVGIERVRFLAVREPGDHPLVSVVAFLQLISVGSIRFRIDDGEILFVWVTPGHRRRGIATAMHAQAGSLASSHGWAGPRHSKTRTIDGDAWAQALGAVAAETIWEDSFDDPDAP